MRWFKNLLFRICAVARRHQIEMDLADELKFHLEAEIEKNVAAGMNPEEARYAAARSFGGMEQVKEECRDMIGVRFIAEACQDLRYGLRMLAKSPGFSAVAVLCLALGIGANTAIFSLIDVALLRPLPVAQPHQLVRVDVAGSQGTGEAFSYPTYEMFRDHNEVFSGVLAFDVVSGPLTAHVNGPAELADGQLVSGNYFSVLGVNAFLGRTLTAEDDQVPGLGGSHGPVAAISYGYWQRHFALDSAVIGKVITLNSTPFSIVGVLPKDFSGTVVGRSPDIYLPLVMQPQIQRLGKTGSVLSEPEVSWLRIMGRRKPGVTEQQARSNLDAIFREIQNTAAGRAESQSERLVALERRIILRSGSRGISILSAQFSQTLIILMAMVGVVLLIACSNVANLLLARTSTRKKEIAVRLAIGAGRGRLVRQLLTESMLLSAVGAVSGLLMAIRGGDFLLVMFSTELTSITLDIKPDLRILWFTGAVATATALLFGLTPALLTTRFDLNPMLRENVRAHGQSGSGLNIGKILVIGQVGLSLLLVVVAGLFVRSLHNLKSQDLGFNRENVLLFRINPEVIGYERNRAKNLYKKLLNRIEQIAGVRSASLSEYSPMDGYRGIAAISVPGYTPQSDASRLVDTIPIGPGFFETMGMALLLGRAFSPQDNGESPKVAVINETMAHFYFQDENPVGRIFTREVEGSSQQTQIVGVVRDSKFLSPREQVSRAVYVPFLQTGNSPWGMTFSLRTVAHPVGLVSQVRREIEAVDQNLPLSDVRMLDEQVDYSLLRERLIATLATLFGLLAVFLGCIGLYGVMSYVVARRTGEIGIRLALGATTRNILWLVMREAMLLVLIGLAIGLPATLATTRLISSELFGLTNTDSLTISLATLLLVTVAFVAAYLPARRAARVDPMVTLRTG